MPTEFSDNSFVKKPTLYYPYIDIAKFVMAFLVIIIHKPPFPNSFVNTLYFVQETIAGVAVPFFFVCSGFFFAKKIAKDSSLKSAFGYIKRIFILYAVWTIIYLPCIFVKNYTGHYDEVTFNGFIGFLFTVLKSFVLSSSFVHFWYLSALILSIIILYLLQKKLSCKTVLIVCAVVSAAVIIAGSFQTKSQAVSAIFSVYKCLPSVLTNTIRVAMPCVSFGFFFGNRSLAITCGAKKVCVAVLAAYLAVDVMLSCMFGQDSLPNAMFHGIAVMISAICFFMIVAQPKSQTSAHTVRFRNMSTLIYCCHLLLMSEAYNLFFVSTGIDFGVFNNLFIFATDALFALSVSVIIVSLQSKIKSLRVLY